MKKVSWSFKVESNLAETVTKYLKEIKKKHIYLNKTDLFILAVTSYMKQNPAEED